MAAFDDLGSVRYSGGAMKRLLPALALVGSLAALVFGQVPKATFSGKVVGVHDGDTITVLRSGGTASVKVRLDGVDAPETTQPFGSASKAFASDMAFGKGVTVEVMDTDRYGRTVGRVHVGGLSGPSLNVASVKAGMAWWYRHYAPKAFELKNAEAEARAAKRGLWSEPGAVAPWDFRHGKVASNASTVSRKRHRAPLAARAPVGTTVYVTETGSKYHAAGCRYLRRSSIPMRKSEAVKRYSACSVCGGG